MKAVYVKNYGFWSVVLLVGVVLVAAGLFRLSDFRSSRSGETGEPLPNPGETVKTGLLQPEDQQPLKKTAAAFFVEYRLERDRTRSQQFDLYRELVNNPHTSEQDRSEAQRRLIWISQAMDVEMKLENLIRAENFKDAVALVQEESATVIVQTPLLTGPDAQKLRDITARLAGVGAQNIEIIAKSE